MFPYSIDNKPTYSTDDGTVFVDLSESIFDRSKAISELGTFYKVPKIFEMRPDLIAISVYGNVDYTEMVLKYSAIMNPFSVEYNDIIRAVSIGSIYNPLKIQETVTNGMFNALKNYHKYIDKSKVPSSYSEVNDVQIVSQDSESNLSEKDDNGIVVKNGKLYFGVVDEELKDANSDLVDCAVNGTTIGEFINATIKNS